MKHRLLLSFLLLLGVASAGCGKESPSSSSSSEPGEASSNASGEAAGKARAPGAASGGDGAQARGDIRIVVVTHGQASDAFWSVVKNGVDHAARDMGIEVEYQAPNTFDMVTMSQLIDAAVASEPDGLVVSIPDPDALRRPITKAIEAGIPVVSINSGSEVAKELGVMTHIGQTEYEAGFGAGERMAGSGVKQALCVNHEVGNTAQDLRCKGFMEAVQEQGATAEVLAVDLADPTELVQRVKAALAANPAIDGILTLGPTSADPTLRALKQDGKLGEVALATFDLSPEVLAALRDGEMLFAVDQQQYLQGYMPIVLLTLYQSNLNTPAYDVLRTGPGFVDQASAARVIELSKKGTR